MAPFYHPLGGAGGRGLPWRRGGAATGIVTSRRFEYFVSAVYVCMSSNEIKVKTDGGWGRNPLGARMEGGNRIDDTRRKKIIYLNRGGGRVGGGALQDAERKEQKRMGRKVV